MKITLVNPPTLYRAKPQEQINLLEGLGNTIPYYDRLLSLDESKRNGYSTLPGEHLGLQSLAAFVQNQNHTVTIINACVERHTSLNQTLNRLLHSDFELLGLTGPLDVFGENVWLATKLREAGFTGHITLGHDFATLNHSVILKNYQQFNSIIRGEGELTLLELVNRLESDKKLFNVLGLSFRDDSGKVVINPPRRAIANLDVLPWPIRTDIKQVTSFGMSPSLYTRRGCPYKCSFCTTGIVPEQEGYVGKSAWRARSAQNIVDEIEYLQYHHFIPFLTIVDDLFIAKGKYGSEHATSFAHEILNRNINIEFMIDCRVDSISLDTFTLLKRAGLRKVFVGVESASEDALQAFNKGYSPSIIRKKLEILDKLGIEFILGFIMFNPFETLEGLSKSYQLIMDLNRRDFGLFLQSVRIYPGTPLYHQLKEHEQLQGTFPYFSALYTDNRVDEIRNMLSEFGNLAVPLLRSITTRNDSLANRIHHDIFDIFSLGLKNIIDSMKNDDYEVVRSHYIQMTDRFQLLLDEKYTF